VGGERESARVAARRLGVWQATTPIPQVPWLAGHQLAQRVAVSELDFRGAGVDRRLVEVWERREALLTRLAGVPDVVSHGDFSMDNLVAGPDRTVVLDWATFGVCPVGADLAHLALSSLEDVLEDYLAGLGERFDGASVRLGYQVTAALTGASRMHWMRTNGVPVPDGYQEFVVGLLG
jgi:aminoglycoside phosphotransferase (APT) family kinase protein